VVLRLSGFGGVLRTGYVEPGSTLSGCNQSQRTAHPVSLRIAPSLGRGNCTRAWVVCGCSSKGQAGSQ